MIIAEVKNELTTVRIHDESCRNETEQTMLEISQIVSQAYQRRASAPYPMPFENLSMGLEH